jgi:hypothetical protein
VPIVHIRHALPASDHRHARLVIVHSVTALHVLRVTVRLPAHVLQATAHLAIVHHVLPVIVRSVTALHVPQVTAHSVVLQEQRVVQLALAAVDSTPVLWVVASAALYQVAVAATQVNVATALTEKALYAVLMPPRAMVRDVAKARRPANQAR